MYNGVDGSGSDSVFVDFLGFWEMVISTDPLYCDRNVGVGGIRLLGSHGLGRSCKISNRLRTVSDKGNPTV